VDPASGGAPGFAPFSVELVDNIVASNIKGQLGGKSGTIRVLTYTKVFGHTLGGTRVESNEFLFPVDICFGCLVTFPQGVSSPLFPEP
ncbi:hypothetical protein ACSLVQ_28865, partial [Klebsiella pneumoniae]|uniref:hypothetical protein n=1 Tax=Klebsiella pneumoniae TaxID=573 RepID=UPI003EE25E0F